MSESDLQSTMVLEVGLKGLSHEADVIRILQNKNNLELGVQGNDGTLLKSEKLLVVSPFIRSVLDHQKSLTDNLLILPDFSSVELERGLALLEFRAGEDLVFSNTTKSLLETLGVDLNNTELLEEEPNEAEEPLEAGNMRTTDDTEAEEDEDDDTLDEI